MRALHHRVHEPGPSIHGSVESHLWTAGFTILALLILFLGVFVPRAS